MKGRNHKFIQKTFHDDALRIDPKFKKELKSQLFKGDNTMAKTPLQLNLQQLLKQKTFVYAGSLALVLMVGTTAYALENRQTSLSRQDEIRNVVELPQNLSDVLSIDAMKTLAEKDAPAGATITQIEIENEHGAVLYKVKFSDGSFRLYDAVTGLPYLETVDKNVETDDSVPAGFVAGITLQQARDIAAAERPGKTITKIELETEEGVVVYSVRFSDDGRVDVNANNGAIVRVRGADGQKSSRSNDDHDNSDDDNSGSGSRNSGSSNDDDHDDSNDDNSGSGSSGSGRDHSEDD